MVPLKHNLRIGSSSLMLKLNNGSLCWYTITTHNKSNQPPTYLTPFSPIHHIGTDSLRSSLVSYCKARQFSLFLPLSLSLSLSLFCPFPLSLFWSSSFVTLANNDYKRIRGRLLAISCPRSLATSNRYKFIIRNAKKPLKHAHTFKRFIVFAGRALCIFFKFYYHQRLFLKFFSVADYVYSLWDTNYWWKE